MAGQTSITQYMDAIGNIARAFPIGTGGGLTVEPGKRTYADNENFEALIRGLNPVTPTAPPASPVQGYFSYWVKDFEFSPDDVSPARIIGELAVFVPKDVSTDMNAAIDFMVNFGNALVDQTNYMSVAGYAAINLIRPRNIQCSLYKIDDAERGGVAIFDFGNYGSGGITLIDP
jgi:hypothetical protein